MTSNIKYYYYPSFDNNGLSIQIPYNTCNYMILHQFVYNNKNDSTMDSRICKVTCSILDETDVMLIFYSSLQPIVLPLKRLVDQSKIINSSYILKIENSNENITTSLCGDVAFMIEYIIS